jgi:hypothetical protein
MVRLKRRREKSPGFIARLGSGGGAGGQQVPPLRRRLRSGSGRNDKSWEQLLLRLRSVGLLRGFDCVLQVDVYGLVAGYCGYVGIDLPVEGGWEEFSGFGEELV